MTFYDHLHANIKLIGAAGVSLLLIVVYYLRKL